MEGNYVTKEEERKRGRLRKKGNRIEGKNDKTIRNKKLKKKRKK